MTITFRQYLAQFVTSQDELGAQTERVLGSLRKSRAQSRAGFTRIEGILMTGFDRLNASYEGLAGDITSLKAAAADLQSALDAALADQDAAVAAAVTAAVAEAQASFDAQLDAVADRFEGLDAATPAVEAPVDPEPAPVDDVPADETPVVPADGEPVE